MGKRIKTTDRSISNYDKVAVLNCINSIA